MIVVTLATAKAIAVAKGIVTRIRIGKIIEIGVEVVVVVVV